MHSVVSSGSLYKSACQTYSTAVEVVSNAEDEGLAGLNPLDLVCPLTGNLDGGLGSLSTSVHGQRHVVAKDITDLLGPSGEDIVVESAGAEGQAAGLLNKDLDELGVAVALVDGTVGRQEVKVVAALGVPDVDALSLGEDNGNGVVVVGGVFVLRGNGLLGGSRVEAGGGGAVAGSGISVRSHRDGCGRSCGWSSV